MKHIFYIILLLLSIKASSQQLEYFKKISTTVVPSDLFDMKTDNLGNTFIALMHKGSLTIGTQTYACNNTNGNFILLKFDSLGNLLWSKMDGLGNYVIGTFQFRNTILIDNSNNVYLVGALYDSAIFSGIKIKGAMDDFRTNYFLVKYNNDGQLKWARSYGSYETVDIIENLLILNNNSIVVIGKFGGTLGDSTNIDGYKLKLPSDQLATEYLAEFDTVGNLKTLKEFSLIKTSQYSYPLLKYMTQSNNELFISGETWGTVIYGNDTINFNSSGYGILSKLNLSTQIFIKTRKDYDYSLASTNLIQRGILDDNISIINKYENNGTVKFSNGVTVYCPFPSSTHLTHTIVTKLNKASNITTFSKGLSYYEQKGFIANGKYISVDVDNPPLPVDNIVLANKGVQDIYIMEMDSNYSLQKYKSIASTNVDFMPLGTSKNNFIYGLAVSNGTGTIYAFDSIYTKTDAVNFYLFKVKILAPPIAPVNLTTTHTGSNNVKLQWTDKSSDESKFRIYRSNSASGPFTLIDSVAPNITIYNHLNSNTGLQYYQVCAVNSEGQNCSNISSVALGMNSNQNLASNFNIYPNPFTNNIQISSSDDIEIKEISLFNVLGDRIQIFEVSNKSKTSLNASSLPSGVYFLKVLTSDYQEITYKVIK